MADYISKPDADFNIQQGVIVKESTTNATAWGIATADVTALAAKQTTWTNAYAPAANKNGRSHPDVVAKDDARADYEKALRKFVAQWLANNPKVPNSEREKMGLTVKSETHTPVPVPKSFPVATVDFSVRLQHTISFVDSETPKSKAKPTGVHGCEIWAKIGEEAPKSEKELGYLATNTASPYVHTFEGEEAAKIVFYWLRWVNTKGEPGPWGAPVSAMVAG